jgi:hypothetical protein
MEKGRLVMEIAPIPGIRTVQAVKAPPSDGRLSSVFDIENSSGPGDDTYSGNGRKASGGQDAEEEEELESDSDSPVNGGSIDFLV